MPYLEYDDHGTMKRINLAGDRETFIGRDRQCHICLEGVPQVSRRHCAVYFNTNLNAYALADMHSTNGTRLNGVRINQKDVTLSDGDTIQVGAEELLQRPVPGNTSRRNGRLRAALRLRRIRSLSSDQT